MVIQLNHRHQEVPSQLRLISGPLLTCQSGFSEDLEDQLLHGFVGAQLLPRTADTVLLSQSLELLLIGHHEANHIRLIAAEQETTSQGKNSHSLTLANSCEAKSSDRAEIMDFPPVR